MLVVTVALVMALIMAFGAGAAFADWGGGGHHGTVGDCQVMSGGSGGPGGGSGGVAILCGGEPQTETVSGGGGGPGGGAGGRCEGVDLP